ncbi:tripartite tricarboxylate transporter TctB family protein [Chelativorans sp. YIM 93263]|uniref:tripartite tricarboxylate transporter TctB family protein n=1 Tax=Chelativorans sp. YIM 93263 TaxID=2906648 RepID=UPI002379A574|nr:tripartite tricarboxylate transporter TctB family protein [Chelativorans sp. YIM 93263]
MTRLLRGQVVFALGLAALNTVYASQLLQMDRPFANGEPGPAFLPLILCGFMYVASIIIVVGEFRTAAAARESAPQSDVISRIALIGPALTISATALFIVTFFYFGYLVSAAVFTFIVSLFFNYEKSGDLKRSSLIALITAFTVTLFGWLFFVKLFGLYLPVWEL